MQINQNTYATLAFFSGVIFTAAQINDETTLAIVAFIAMMLTVGKYTAIAINQQKKADAELEKYRRDIKRFLNRQLDKLLPEIDEAIANLQKKEKDEDPKPQGIIRRKPSHCRIVTS